MTSKAESLRAKLFDVLRRLLLDTNNVVTIIALIGLLALLLISPAILKTNHPIAYVASGSMEPSYYTGDLIIVEGKRVDNLEVGDSILYAREDGTIIFHRIAYIYEKEGMKMFLTKGDHNNIVDSWSPVPENRVLGVVIYRIPLLGFIPLLAKDYGLWPIFIMLLGLLLVAPEPKISKMALRKAEALIVIIFAFATIVYASVLGNRVDVKIVAIRRVITTTRIGDVPYFLVRVRVTSPSWLSSVRKLTVILVLSDGSTHKGAWKLCYNFVGTKEFSIAVVVEQYNLDVVRMTVEISLKGLFGEEIIRKDILPPV